MLNFWSASALFFFACVLAACGGGGGNSGSSSAPPAAEPRHDGLLFGYFGNDDASIRQTAAHVNLTFELGWGDASTAAGRQAISDRHVKRLAEAHAAGVDKAIVAVDYLMYAGSQYRDGRQELRALFTQLQYANLLSMVVAVYPIDEPDNAGVSDETATHVNADVRAVMAEFFELRNTAVAVIYGQRGANTPGLASYDWLGFDDYDSGAAVLGGEYQAFRAKLNAQQRVILVPGGGDPWRTAPDAFMARASSDGKVVAVVPFIWIATTNGAGIATNGNAAAYCLAGARIKDPAATPAC